MDQNSLGRAVLRAYMNLMLVPLSPATVLFDATRRAGGAMDLALRIRRIGSLDGPQLRTFGELAGLSPFDLRLWCLPALEKAGLIEARRAADGEVLDIEERVGATEPVLDSAAKVWEGFDPSAAERCALESSDHLAYAPLPESVHRRLLEVAGFPGDIHKRAFMALGAIGILRRQRSNALGEDVLYSPYVWGTEAVEIAEFLNQLPANEREALTSLHRTVVDRPGTSVDALGANRRLLSGARKIGLVDATRVLTSEGKEQAFAFSPALERQLQLGSTDVAHERKLFVSHILYGHRYGFPGTGRIGDPIVLVDALIRRGRVGPASAIRSDYPLLEARGIVRVVDAPGTNMAYLELVKEDVAKDSLDLLRLALGQPVGTGKLEGPLGSLWVPGTVFTSPERDRRELRDIPPGAEAELLTSTVEELRSQIARTLRREDLS